MSQGSEKDPIGGPIAGRAATVNPGVHKDQNPQTVKSGQASPGAAEDEAQAKESRS